MHRRLPILPSRRPKATFGGMLAATYLFERSPFARVMADVPVTVYDVGARGGVDLDLLPFAVDAVAFEPHPEEYKRLVDGGAGAGPWRSLRHLPYAVSGTGGRRPLFVTADSEAAFLGDRYAIRAAPALRRTSRMYARRACLRALARHLRGLGPYVRTTAGC